MFLNFEEKIQKLYCKVADYFQALNPISCPHPTQKLVHKFEEKMFYLRLDNITYIDNLYI